MKHLAREPLVHFVLLACVLFLAHAFVTRNDDRRIVVSRATRSEIEHEISSELGRPPTTDELSAAFDNWKRDEVLYREGLRRGLDRDDPILRSRIATKFREIEEATLVPKTVSDADLDAWLAAHRSFYEVPLSYDFEHVFAAKEHGDARERAVRFADDLAAGKSAETLGDPFPQGRIFTAQNLPDIRLLFGDAFANAFSGLPVGKWQIVESAAGWHVVRVRLVTGGLPAREDLKRALFDDFLADARKRATEQVVRELLSQYRFVDEP